MKRITFFAFLFACTLGFSQQAEIKGSGTDNPVNGPQRHAQNVQSKNSDIDSGKREVSQLNAVNNPSSHRNGQPVSGSTDATLKNAAFQGLNQPENHRASSPAYIFPVNVQDQEAEISANAIYAAGNRAPNESPIYGANRPMADIVPTAGATQTFTPSVGDNFFDPGGPGGSSTGGTPGNYPNCGCATQTTLEGVSEINFLFFSVFATFDYLRIYDGTDATGTILYDNSSTGANADDITLDEMIASHGSSTFTSTSGNFFFYFHASTVVDYGGWDVEIVAADGGSGGVFPEPYCGVTYNTVEPISLVEVAGIDNRSSEVINGSPAHEDFTTIIGAMEAGESYTIALEGNTNGGFTCSFTVFIDWNQNEVFDNASERYEIGTIFNSTGIDGQQATGTITVPEDAVEGSTRMRVLKRFGSAYSVDACTGSSWGQAEDYTIEVTAGGGSGDLCSEENPNDFTFENGFNISSTTAFKTANDVTVAADEDFTLTNITASIFANGGISNIDVTYYADAAGLPGAIIGSENSVTIDSQNVIGANFGIDVNEVELTVTPFVFSGQAGSETKYWIELIATDGGVTGSVFWVVTSSSSIGSPTAQFDGGWALDATGMDGVYIFEGECAPMEDGGDDLCSQENPNDGTFENGFNISSTSAFKTANDVTVAADEDFTLTNITASIFANGGISNVDVVYYADAAGLPGNVIGSQNSVTIDSQNVIGANFGIDVNELEMTVTPFVFNGQAGSETKYWIELIATDGGVTGSVFWVVTSSSSIGSDTAQFDGGWTINTDGMDGVYIFEGDCAPMDGGDDLCSQENPNDGTFENGFNISSTSAFKTANDVIVAAGEDFTLTNITASIFANGGISNVDVVYYDDAAGLPGNVIGSQNSVTIDSQNVIGANFGIDVNELEMTVTPFVFNGQAGSDTKYWIELIATDGGVTGSVFWVVTSSSSIGSDTAQFDGGWAINTDGMDGVYIFEGDCAPMDGGDDMCSQENPNDGTFENGFNISSTSAFQTANDVIVAAGENFTLTNITASIFANGGISNVDVVYYDDASGLPGNVIGSQNSVTIDSQNVIGANFGIDVNELEMTVTPFVFEGQEGSETRYWIELIATDGGVTGSVFWVVTSSSSIGLDTAQFDGGWSINTDGMDGVYIFDGECIILSVADAIIDGFTYYPNPTSGMLNLSADKNIQDIAVFNMLGQQVINSKVGATSTEIDFSSLAIGTYVMKVTIDGQVGTYKVIRN